MSLTERLSHGLQFLAAYTFAKSIDNASGSGGGAGITGVVNTGAVNDSSSILGNQNNPNANRGVSDFDRTHRFVLSYLWDLPKPRFAARHCSAGKLELAFVGHPYGDVRPSHRHRRHRRRFILWTVERGKLVRSPQLGGRNELRQGKSKRAHRFFLQRDGLCEANRAERPANSQLRRHGNGRRSGHRYRKRRPKLFARAATSECGFFRCKALSSGRISEFRISR